MAVTKGQIMRNGSNGCFDEQEDQNVFRVYHDEQWRPYMPYSETGGFILKPGHVEYIYNDSKTGLQFECVACSLRQARRKRYQWQRECATMTEKAL